MSDLVLVIEDDEDIREIVCELLDERGLDVVAARSARLGMSILQSGLRPSLILLDIKMAGFNGIDFRRAQLADPTLALIPVVAMTASPGVLDDEPDLVWSAVLGKPIVIEKLVDCVSSVLRDPGRRAAQR